MAVRVWSDQAFPKQGQTHLAVEGPNSAGNVWLKLGKQNNTGLNANHIYGIAIDETMTVPAAPSGFYAAWLVARNSNSGANFVEGMHCTGVASATMTSAGGGALAGQVNAAATVGNIRGVTLEASTIHTSGTVTITTVRGIWRFFTYKANTTITTFYGDHHDWTTIASAAPVTITTAYGQYIELNPASVATITTAYGLYIHTVGATTAWGIFQNGTEQNKLKGRLLFATPNSALTDADLENASTSLYLDQTNNALKVRAKYSDGTLKLGTIPFGSSPTASQNEWQFPIRTVTISDTILPEDTCIIVNTASAITLTLPAANAHTPRGKMLILLKRSGSILNRITISRAGTDTIDDATTTSVSFENGETVMLLYSDASSRWYVHREATSPG